MSFINMTKRARKRKMGSEDKAVYEWEKEKFLSESLREEMESSYELPQIYFFLSLTRESFNITHLSMYEVERMLLMPKASKQLCHIMTCLLCNPSSMKSKCNVPPMPYSFWTNLVIHKLMNWFKVYNSKHQNALKTFDILGIEPEFWKIFKDVSEIEKKDFQDFTFKQRIWLLKTICDTAMHSRKLIQDEIAKQPIQSQLETVLGVDRYGARYIYFPQFLHNDLRVYRHCIDNKVLSSVKSQMMKEKPKVEVTVKKVPKPATQQGRRKKRRSRWSKGSLPPKVQKKTPKTKVNSCQTVDPTDSNATESNSDSLDTEQISRSSSKASEMSAGSFTKSSDNEINSSTGMIENKSEIISNQKDISNPINESRTGEKAKDQTDDFLETSLERSTSKSSEFDGSFTKFEPASIGSKTDDEKIKEMKATKNLEQTDVNSISNLSVNQSIQDNDIFSKDKACDTPTSECASEELSLVSWMQKKLDKNNSLPAESENEASDSLLPGLGSRRGARIKLIFEVKSEVEDAENIIDMCETEELSSIDLRDSLCRVSSPEENFYNEDFDEKKWKVDSFNELISDLGVSSFQLVADSLDSLKDLIEYISSDKTVPAYETKETFEVPKSEVSLVKRMKKLAKSLEDVDAILKESTKKAKNKLQREFTNFENSVTDEDQKQQDENASNCWLIGPQGCSIEQLLSTEQYTETLSQTALPRDITKESESKDAQADFDSKTPSSGNTYQTDEIKEEAGEEIRDCKEVGENQEKERDGQRGEEEEGQERQKTRGRKQGCGTEDINKAKKDKSEEATAEARPTRRVLRARGVPSYTEQFFSDDESEEDQFNSWADIEGVYAPANPAVSTSDAASTASQRNPTATDSYDDEAEEDSDQDWILPSTRKRKSKRPSANRRLKTFQNKIQNIQENKTADGSQQQVQPANQVSHVPPTKIAISRQFNNRRYNQQISRAARLNNNALVSSTATAPLAGVVKTEPQDPNLHSELDIKDEGPTYAAATTNRTNVTTAVQSNYVVVTSGQAPVADYCVVQRSPSNVVSQNQYIQPTAFVPQMQVQNMSTQGYYVQTANPAQPYIVQNSTGIITTTPRPTFIASTTPVVYQQTPTGTQLITNQQQIVQSTPNYVQYVSAPVQPHQRPAQPRIINAMTLTPPRQINRTRLPGPSNRMPGPLCVGPRPNFPHPPNGAVIGSAPIASNVLRPGRRIGLPRNPGPGRQVPRMPNPGEKKSAPVKVNASQGQGKKSTSLIVLSDSDDEIEMIIPEGSTAKPKPKQTIAAASASESTASSSQLKKSVIPPELLERMNEGNISLSPIKPAQPAPSQSTSSSTRLVVVVNETGSHYALALPNGSKLILTPEQVAQIRASNGGKLVL